MTHIFRKWVPQAIARTIVGLSIGLLLLVAHNAGDHNHETDHKQVAQTGHAHDPTNTWAISRGGQLYDKWWEVIEADEPTETHPAYSKEGKKTGSTT